MKKGLIVIFLILIVKYTFGQEFTDLYGDYLGQTPPGDTPVVFARGIVSTDFQNHGAPSFSPDGNEIFWQANKRPRNDSEKWVAHCMTMRRIGGRWTTPEVSSFGSSPIFSSDGKQILFGSKKEGDDPNFMEKHDNGLSEPKRINLVSRFPELKFVYNLSITSNGTIYFISYAAGLGTRNNYGIYRTELIDGEYAKPELLPASVNMSGFLNWTPFISPDESYLLFSSNRSGSLDEYGDLYICFRKPDMSWTDAVSLGNTINSNQQERFPSISPDGKYLFFSRWTPDFDEDVFWVNAKIIERLREKNKEKK